MPTLEAFDKKLGEADAYLQLLIEQVKVCSSFLDHKYVLILI